VDRWTRARRLARQVRFDHDSHKKYLPYKIDD
jgi:hypothetical protein